MNAQGDKTLLHSQHHRSEGACQRKLVLVVNHVGPYGTEIDRMRREVTAARKPRRRREFLRRRFLKMNTFGANVCCSITAVTEAPATYGCVERSSAPLRLSLIHI